MEAHHRVRRLRKQFGINFLCVVGMIAGGPIVYNELRTFLMSDPFKSLFATSAHDLDDSIGIRMDSVDLRDYHGAKLVSSAHAQRVDVRKDRQGFTVYKVTKGLYNGQKGKFAFSADTAVWNLAQKTVTVNNHITVQNQDLNLKATGLTYDDATSKMAVYGNVTGRLYQGQLCAANVAYNLETGGADAGPIDWKGTLNFSPQDEDQTKPRQWTVHGAHMKSLSSNDDIYIYEKATATDGEILLKAPIIEQNRKTDVLNAKGGVEYYSGKADLTADSCIVYRKEKRAILTGNVIMYVKPKKDENDPPKEEALPVFKAVTPDQVTATPPSATLNKDEEKAEEDELRSTKNLRDFPLVVLSQKTDYWYAKGNRHAVISGDPQGRQRLKNDEWRHLWSHIAYYDGEKETLKLVSTENKKDTISKNSIGDRLNVVDMTVSTKEDDDSMDCSDPEGVINTIDDEIPRDDKKKSGTGNSGGANVPPPTGKSGGGGPTGT